MLDLSYAAIGILCFTVVIAGYVRGLTGFGDALIFMPIGAMFLPPVGLFLTYMIVASSGPIPLLPQAWRVVDRKRLLSLNIPALLLVPIGFWLTNQIDPTVFRLIISVLAISVAALMLSGWKPVIPPTTRNMIIAGALAGFIGGLTGVPGAILIFVFLNSGLDVAQIRSTITLTLFSYAVLVTVLVIAFGGFEWTYVGISLALIPLFILGSLIGKKMFKPSFAPFFRRIAIATIFFSGIAGMPYGLFT